MKKILLIMLLMIGSLTTNAQIKLSAKVGANINASEFNFSDASNLKTLRNPAGIHAGLALKVKVLPLFYIQGDALYSYNTYKFSIEGNGDVKTRNHTIQVPVVFGLQAAFFRVYVGPRFSFDLNSKDIFNSNHNIDFKLSGRNVGYQAGIGINILKMLTIDVSYNGYFKRSAQKITIDNRTYDEKLSDRQIWVTLGFIIL